MVVCPVVSFNLDEKSHISKRHHQREILQHIVNQREIGDKVVFVVDPLVLLELDKHIGGVAQEDPQEQPDRNAVFLDIFENASWNLVENIVYSSVNCLVVEKVKRTKVPGEAPELVM